MAFNVSDNVTDFDPTNCSFTYNSKPSLNLDNTDVDLYNAFNYEKTTHNCSTTMKMQIYNKDGTPFNIKSRQLNVPIP